MSKKRAARRLVAILAADVVGYSRLMGRDEEGTLARLQIHRTERFDPIIAGHDGRLVKLTGDGSLVEFGSAVAALHAAIEIQRAMAGANRDQPEDARIVFRIGLHIGDVIVEGDDIYGDGVNVAARLEAEAPAGGIVISGNLHDAVVGRLQALFEDLGELTLKNIDRPVRAYRVEEPSLLQEILAALDRWPEWKLMRAAPGRLAELENRLATPATNMRTGAEACPKCKVGTLTMINEDSAPPPLNRVGIRRQTYDCSAPGCDYSTERFIEPDGSPFRRGARS